MSIVQFDSLLATSVASEKEPLEAEDGSDTSINYALLSEADELINWSDLEDFWGQNPDLLSDVDFIHPLATALARSVECDIEFLYQPDAVALMTRLLTEQTPAPVIARVKRYLVSRGADMRHFAALIAEHRQSAELVLAPALGDPLESKSDVALARVLTEGIAAQRGQLVHADGRFWAWNGRTHWAEVDEDEIRRAVHHMDGAFVDAGTDKEGNPKTSRLSLTKSKIDGILHEAAVMVRQKGFFDIGESQKQDGEAPRISCESGVVTFDENKNLMQFPHSSEWRVRHLLAGIWEPDGEAFEGGVMPRKGTYLHRFLSGCFGDLKDNIKEMYSRIAVLQEFAGCVAMGMSTRLIEPKMLMLHGPYAGNGKTEYMKLLQQMVPPEATVAVSIKDFGDEKSRVQLVGKLLNVVDEMPGAGAIASDDFKAIITGGQISGRDVYESATFFMPMAAHVVGGQHLPVFSGGLDEGVRRRLKILPFLRTIPKAERVADIAAVIGREEPDLLLAWALEGARRLWINGDYTTSDDMSAYFTGWAEDADTILGWLARGIQYDMASVVLEADAYLHYRAFCAANYAGNAIVSQRTWKNKIMESSGGKITKAARHGTGVRIAGFKLQELPDTPSKDLTEKAQALTDHLSLRLVK